MRIFVKDLSTGEELDVTRSVCDELGVESVDESTIGDIEIGFDIARIKFGHNNVDCFAE